MPSVDAERRVDAVRPGPDDARDEHDAAEHDRQADEHAPRRPLAEDQPRDERDDDDLEVPEHGGETRPDRVDRVVPRQQVGREEHAGDDREPHGAGRQRAVAPMLVPADEGEDRQPVQAAEDRGRRGRDLREPVEDARERDEHRAGERGEARPAGDGLEEPRAVRPPRAPQRW